jgi:hypothetical protein
LEAGEEPPIRLEPQHKYAAFLHHDEENPDSFADTKEGGAQAHAYAFCFFLFVIRFESREPKKRESISSENCFATRA